MYKIQKISLKKITFIFVHKQHNFISGLMHEIIFNIIATSKA